MPIIDDFFYKQPPKDFVEQLKMPLHMSKPQGFGARKALPDEIDMTGMFLNISFKDKDGLLETAFADFNRFLDVYEIGGNRFEVSVEFGITSVFEEYRIIISENGAKLVAADTEGIRRALVYLEDLIIESEGAYLKALDITRKPVIKSRITRCFFGPINRAPLHIDELYDDIDYYPEEYLNRIAHDGNNGIWIYTNFKHLLSSSVIKEYGAESEKRLEKLRRVVKKCARYGIKVYVFAVEPSGIPVAIEDNYKDMWGPKGWAECHSLCTRTERGAKYIVEAMERLFRAVPDLGGYIDITTGERVTSCSSVDTFEKCPRCGKYSRGENLAQTVSLIREGMRRAGAKGEFISWTYGHRTWDFDGEKAGYENIKTYVRNAPDDVMLMQNFDDMGVVEQLGKKRLGVDYWLSYPGPSELFTQTADEAIKQGKHVYAKMQICCSHEIATVPYIPTPGLVFDKYSGAYDYKVEGILQCWYFGNYPSIMSKAAGELSFTTDFSDKNATLRHIAGMIYGKSNSEKIAKAWEIFSDAYSNYPLNIMFSYYGPMHDGVVWELALKPKNRPLPRTWQLLDKTDGDRITEALWNGHTLEEAIILCEKMRDIWNEGLEILPHEVVGEFSNVAKALGLMFESGCNILSFYLLRRKLGYAQGNPGELLDEMRKLVNKEIDNSIRMSELCKIDPRLGYHSEAEGYKYFPEKLEYRVGKLRELLETEFIEVEQRVADGKAPLEYFTAENVQGYKLDARGIENAKWESVGESHAFRASVDEDNIYLDIRCSKNEEVDMSMEYVLTEPSSRVNFKNGSFFSRTDSYLYCPHFDWLLEKEKDKYKVTQTDFGMSIVIDRKKVSWTNNTPIKMLLKIGGDMWIHEDDPVHHLGKHPLSPGEYGWLTF